MSSFSLPALAEGMRLEVLQVDAAPLIRRVLDRLDLPGLFERHLPLLPGRPADVPSSTILCALLSNLLLARQPLYAMSAWAATFVPEHLGLLPGQAALLNDDRCGRSFDHLWRSKRASLFTAIALGAIHNYELGMKQRTVLIEFDSVAQAIAAHDSPGYQEALRALGKSVDRDLRIVEGLE